MSTAANKAARRDFLVILTLAPTVDPEMRAEFEEQQRKGPMSAITGGQQPASSLSNFDMAAFLAGSKPKDSGSSTPTGGSAGKSQGVRR